MWVLEARENAEKVWYPVVWEEKKDASNVIDYNIRDEQTIEQSSVFDANNDTTTGMANVIPWVNAPKLIESTSIYKNVPSKTAYAKSYWDWWTSTSGASSWQLRPITIQEQNWAYTYKVGNYFNWYTETPNSCIIIPEWWVYMITCTYYSSVNVFHREYDVYLNLDKVYHLQNDSYYSQHWNAYPSETFYISANKGDQFAIIYIINNWASWQWMWYSVTTEFTKLS